MNDSPESSGAGAATTAQPRGRTIRRRVLRYVERVFACIGLCFVAYHLTFQLTVMTSDSMSPTLQGTSYANGDRILIEKITGWCRSPRRWEIYCYYDDDGTLVTKRIVGMPGEKISIVGPKVHINGAPLERPKDLAPIRYYAYGNLAKGHEVNCENGYFMLGDASIDSLDSRFTGPVTKERFRGRVWCVVAPAGRRGFVH